VDMKGEGER